MGNIRFGTGIGVALMGTFMLAACNNAKSEFVADCASGNLSVQHCECAFDLGAEGLEKSQMALFAAVLSDNQRKVAQSQAELGLVGTGIAMAKIGWIAANAEQACFA